MIKQTYAGYTNPYITILRASHPYTPLNRSNITTNGTKAAYCECPEGFPYITEQLKHFISSQTQEGLELCQASFDTCVTPSPRARAKNKYAV